MRGSPWTLLNSSSGLAGNGQGTVHLEVLNNALKLYWQPTTQTTPNLVAFANDSSLTTGMVGMRLSQGASATIFTADTVQQLNNVVLPFAEDFTAANYPNSFDSQLSNNWKIQAGGVSIVSGTATGQGGIWIYKGGNIGPNVPGCLDKKGMSSCASAYDAVVECLVEAGCNSCTDQTSETTCQQTIFGTGGACQSYYATFQSACATDVADGGLLNGGPCTTDPEVLSVICGNGPGDGG